MRTSITICVAILLTCDEARAVPISLFQDTDTFIERAADIVIAKCDSVPKQGGEAFMDGLYPVHVDVLMVLKGGKNPGPLKIVTIYPMEVGTTYLLSSSGGSDLGTDFLAIPQLSVVPIPATFDLKTLTGKSTKEQVQRVFARYLHEVERKLAPLLETQSLLERGLNDRKDDVYESPGDVHITTIYDSTTESERGRRCLNLKFATAKLCWSECARGRQGFLYFNTIGTSTFVWEFAASPYQEINDLDGKPLRAKFYGRFSPCWNKTTLRWCGGDAIHVTVGQVLLARTVDDPTTIYIVKIERQEKDREAMSVKYAIVRGSPLEVPAKIDQRFRPEPGMEYAIVGNRLFRTEEPGPAEMATSLGWSLANEFVYRTSLAEEYVLPAGWTERVDGGAYRVRFHGKHGQEDLLIEVHTEKKSVRWLRQSRRQPQPQNLTMTLAWIADSKDPGRKPYIFVINSVAAYRTLDGLKEYLRRLPKGSTLTWAPGCFRIGGEPLLSSEQEMRDFKAFCESCGINFVLVLSG